MRLSISIVALTLAAVGLTAPAFSQVTFMPRRLTGSDMAILRAEAAKLGPQGPTKEAWHNPATGNSGTVTFLGTSTQQDLPCRKFQYIFHTGTPQDGIPYNLTWCEKSAGNWVIGQ
jgi:17 kDa outer membrane surface antigen